MVGKVFNRDEVAALITTSEGLRAGLDITDCVWHWMRVVAYNGCTRRAECCEFVRECSDAEANLIAKLVESGQVAQVACFTDDGNSLLAAL